MFSFWIVTTFALINALLFFGGVLIKDCLTGGKKAQVADPMGRACHETPDKSHAPSRANRLWQLGVLVTTVAVFAIICIPWDETDIYNRMDFLSLTLGAFYLVVLPLILILASKLKGSGKPLALLALAIVSTIGLSGCWDRVEIESRAFVVSIGVDKAEDESNRYTVILSLPTAPDGGEDKSEDDPHHIKKASAQTVTEAIKKIDAGTDTQLYFGQTKMLVLGSALLEEPDLVQGVVDIFDRHPEVDRQMHILAAKGKAADILAAQPPGEALPGQYVSAIYKDRRKIGGTSFHMNLEKLGTQLKYENGVLIPALEAEDDNLSLSGAAVLKNSRKIGYLTDEELRGYLWCVNGSGLGAVVTAKAEDLTVPFKVEKHTAKIRFKEKGGKPAVHIQVELTGQIEELAQGSEWLMRPHFKEHTKHLLETAVKEEILRTAAKMQNDFKLDGYHWLEVMRKKQYSMYQQYAKDWVSIFPTIEIVPNIKVKIKI